SSFSYLYSVFYVRRGCDLRRVVFWGVWLRDLLPVRTAHGPVAIDHGPTLGAEVTQHQAHGVDRLAAHRTDALLGRGGAEEVAAVRVLPAMEVFVAARGGEGVEPLDGVGEGRGSAPDVAGELLDGGGRVPQPGSA